MHAKMGEIKRQGRRRSRKLDEVKKDLQRLGIQNWRNRIKDWDGWRRIVLEAKGHRGL